MLSSIFPATVSIHSRTDGLATEYGICEDALMALKARLLGKSGGPVAIALGLYDLWRRLPPKHRKRALRAAAKHGPRLASALAERRRKRR